MPTYRDCYPLGTFKRIVEEKSRGEVDPAIGTRDRKNYPARWKSLCCWKCLKKCQQIGGHLVNNIALTADCPLEQLVRMANTGGMGFLATESYHLTRPSSYTLSVSAPRGFFGMRELRDFTETVIEPYSHTSKGVLFILDFSLIKMWDVAALLWLTIGLHHYRRQDLRFLLRLPEPKLGISPKEQEELQKSSDYLRRWRFDVALQNLVRDVDDLLVPEQRGYFSQPQKHYLPSTIRTERGVVESLLSLSLVGIRNLVDIVTLSPHEVSEKLIAACIAHFQAARMGDILNVQCGIEKRTSDLFADHLLTESLMNLKEHPNATIGMMAVSVMGAGHELILTVADNGDSICATIFDVFCNSRNIPRCSYNPHELTDTERADIIDFATLPGVTRKSRSVDPGSGMGLTYIKDDVLNTFSGRLRIVSDSVAVRYPAESKKKPYDIESWPHSWKGNLLRIAIPLKKRPELAKLS